MPGPACLVQCNFKVALFALTVSVTWWKSYRQPVSLEYCEMIPVLLHSVTVQRSHRESRCTCLSCSDFLSSSFFKWPQCVFGTVALGTSPAGLSHPAYPHWAPTGSSKFPELPQECCKQQCYSDSRTRSIGYGKTERFLSIKLRLESCVCNREALNLDPIIYFYLL